MSCIHLISALSIFADIHKSLMAAWKSGRHKTRDESRHSGQRLLLILNPCFSAAYCIPGQDRYDDILLTAQPWLSICVHLWIHLMSTGIESGILSDQVTTSTTLSAGDRLTGFTRLFLSSMRFTPLWLMNYFVPDKIWPLKPGSFMQ
jgi:hypothetical protein